MNRWALMAVVVACFFVAGCDDDETGPSNLPLVFSAILSPANEVPPITNSEAGGRGAVQVQFEITRGTGDVITAATATFYFQLTAFPDTTIIGAHIHPGPAGINGPVILSTGLTANITMPLPNGSGERTFTDIPVDPVLVQQIVNNPGAFYFNVHSPLNAGGFARGQLTRVQ